LYKIANPTAASLDKNPEDRSSDETFMLLIRFFQQVHMKKGLGFQGTRIVAQVHCVILSRFKS
jgi:hypothetical protein